MKRAAARRQRSAPADPKRVERLFGRAEDHAHLKLYDNLCDEMIVYLTARFASPTNPTVKTRSRRAPQSPHAGDEYYDQLLIARIYNGAATGCRRR
jgi:hypothetical protein